MPALTTLLLGAPALLPAPASDTLPCWSGPLAATQAPVTLTTDGQALTLDGAKVADGACPWGALASRGQLWLPTGQTLLQVAPDGRATAHALPAPASGPAVSDGAGVAVPLTDGRLAVLRGGTLQASPALVPASPDLAERAAGDVAAPLGDGRWLLGSATGAAQWAEGDPSATPLALDGSITRGITLTPNGMFFISEAGTLYHSTPNSTRAVSQTRRPTASGPVPWAGGLAWADLGGRVWHAVDGVATPLVQLDGPVRLPLRPLDLADTGRLQLVAVVGSELAVIDADGNVDRVALPARPAGPFVAQRDPASGRLSLHFPVGGGVEAMITRDAVTLDPWQLDGSMPVPGHAAGGGAPMRPLADAPPAAPNAPAPTDEANAADTAAPVEPSPPARADGPPADPSPAAPAGAPHVPKGCSAAPTGPGAGWLAIALALFGIGRRRRPALAQNGTAPSRPGTDQG